MAELELEPGSRFCTLHANAELSCFLGVSCSWEAGQRERGKICLLSQLLPTEGKAAAPGVITCPKSNFFSLVFYPKVRLPDLCLTKPVKLIPAPRQSPINWFPPVGSAHAPRPTPLLLNKEKNYYDWSIKRITCELHIYCFK